MESIFELTHNRTNLIQTRFEFKSVEEAPSYYPTEDEFIDPLVFIEQIRPVAEKYGICKIIPPKTWKPKFALDMNNFKFKPRIQRLNELEANSRIKLNFLDKLSKFHELQGNKFKIPIVEKRPLDLYQLYKAVEKMGGYENLVTNKLWSQLIRQLDFKEATSARNVKIQYEKLLYPYLLFEADVTLPLNKTNKNDDSAIADDDYDHEDESESEFNSKAKKIVKKSNKQEIDAEKIELIKCLVCDRGDDEAFMLLCDGCDDSYHTFCLYPPLKEIPKGDWRCPVCVAEICKKPADSYGFEPSSQYYSLKEFGEMANNFKSDYFKKSIKSISEAECEKEFWRILSSPNEMVVVEYGADLHTLETGSGFPTSSNRGKYKKCDDEYVNSPWNLNNLSQHEKSVLSQMNVEISGMKIPWAYVGMCFSCFCWHVEDHWSYSINYLHWGETKTWYGVSGNDADIFEKTMKKNAPELFQKSPDLLHHLVTIMNPNLLKDNGVPIYTVNQRSGEFVITFPRAYHAGFNQGFNFAEAVNFCPADWMSLGRAAIENYKLFRRHSVFSHDELVCKVATNRDLIDINTALAIQTELKLIIETEKNNRKNLMEKGIKTARKFAFELLSDDERTCSYCRTTCFVSGIKCSCCPDNIVCLNHFEYLCKEGHKKINLKQNHYTLLYKYTLEELNSIMMKLKQRTDEYEHWKIRAKKILHNKINNDSDIEEISPDNNSSKKPHINQLFKLVEEAKLKKYPYHNFCIQSKTENTNKKNEYILNELELEFNKAIRCSKLCEKFIKIYKNNSSQNLSLNEMGKEKIKNTKNEDFESDDDIIFIKKSEKSKLVQKASFEQLKMLADDIENLVCEIDEKYLFLSLFNEAIEYKSKIEKLINEWDINSPNQLKRIINYLNTIDIDFPILMVEQLNLMYKQAVWLEKVNNSIHNPSNFSIELIKEFIDQIVEDGLLITLISNPKSKMTVQKTLVDLQELLSIAQTWDGKAKSFIESKVPISLIDLESIQSESKCIPVYMENVERLDKIIKEAKSCVSNIDRLLNEKLPDITDLKESLEKSSKLPIKISQAASLEIRVNLVNDWNNKLKNLFLKHETHESTDDPKSLLEILTPRLDLSALINKLQLQLNNKHSHSTVKSEAGTEKVLSKRIKNRLLNNSDEIKQENFENMIVEDVCSLYSHNKKLLILGEKIKSLKFKELEFIKQLRKLNIDKLSSIVSGFKNEQIDSSNSTNQEQQQTNEPNALAKLSHKNLFNIKCCSCFKSIASSISSNNIQQCKLCLGLYHHTCKSLNIGKTLNKKKTTNSQLCDKCERSKRPNLKLAIECLVSYEHLAITSDIGNALQMFINRVLNWQERFKTYFNNSELKNFYSLAKKDFNAFNCIQNACEIKSMYDLLSVLRKDELNDIYVEGLLLEIDTEEIKLLNEIFDMIDINQKDQLETLKSKIKSCSLLNEANNSTDEAKNKIKKLKYSDNTTTVKKHLAIKKGNDDSATKKNELKLKKNTSNKSRKRDYNEMEEDSDVSEDYCAAPKCTEPTGDNIKWVQCDGDCNRWFHMICVGISKIKKKENYLCNNCMEKKEKLNEDTKLENLHDLKFENETT